MGKYGILVDTTYCTGCNTCFYKCIQENRLHTNAEHGFARTTVFINDEGMYHKRCMHCQDPACVSVCPTGAMYQTEDGIVLHNFDECIACLNCVSACPFEIPQYDEEEDQIVKCTLCDHRIAEGLIPACVDACPVDALEFGSYEDMKSKAEKIASEKDGYVYGIEEAGGTSLSVVTKNEPTEAGFPAVAAAAATSGKSDDDDDEKKPPKDTTDAPEPKEKEEGSGAGVAVGVAAGVAAAAAIGAGVVNQQKKKKEAAEKTEDTEQPEDKKSGTDQK